LPNGGSTQVLVTANVASNASGTLNDTAKVIADQPDPNPSNNASSASVNVNPSLPAQPIADLQVVKHVNRSTIQVGGTLVYTLVVTNNGPGVATDVKLADTPSIPLRVSSVKATQGSCKTAPLSCQLGTIPNGAHVTITVTGKVEGVGTERNVATTTSGSKDPNPANNLFAAKAKVLPKLALSKTGPANVNAGGTVTYQLTASNPTPVTDTQVKVCDTLPAGLVYQSSSPNAKLSNGQQCWSLGTLKGNQHRTVSLTAHSLPGASGNLTNHGAATAKGIPAIHAQHTVHVNSKPAHPGGVTG
jgi:uncharacterized repeat protein (TIGR01451 family)